MLPDFPEVRQLIGRILEEWFEFCCNRRLGLMGRMRKVVMHEGGRSALRRWDGSIERKPMGRIGSAVTLRKEELESKGVGAVLEALQTTAEDMAGKQGRFMIRRINETLEEAGQVRHAKGQALTPGLILEMLDMVDIDFDERGQPKMPTLMCGEALFEAAKKLEPTIEYETKQRQIIESKRLAWREREGDRKLVG
ncbi:MAG TPA: hypothetical protein VM238_08790 [Phycisphaerae bacterium]|nr:hypothetical protein [Phycisphaerae bacterium]